MVTHKKKCLNRGIYPPAEEYMNHAERSSESLVEAFKNMHVHEDALPNDNEDAVDEVLPWAGIQKFFMQLFTAWFNYYSLAVRLDGFVMFASFFLMSIWSAG